MNISHIVGLFTPPLFAAFYRRIFRSESSDLARPQGNYLEGPYVTWHDAVAVSGGYDHETILEKTRTALLQVKNGSAVYERDSVLFDEVQYSWPLLAGLLWVAAIHQGKLRVLDFGGSLGSSYFQNRIFLQGLSEVSWSVVEQHRHVKVGNSDLSNERLRFFDSTAEAVAYKMPNVIILSGVLQYLQEPYEVLSQLLSMGCGHLIIDRTPFWDGNEDILCVQHVPENIYSASYPSWIFSSHILRDFLKDKWSVITEFNSFDRMPGPIQFSYKGMIISNQYKSQLSI